jgi:hypothetical protein
MKLSVRNRWVEALRSGHYKQARYFLRADGAYCALGVLCFSLEDTDSYIELGDLRGTIAGLNDDIGMSFPEIATWIEKHVPVEDDLQLDTIEWFANNYEPEEVLV